MDNLEKTVQNPSIDCSSSSIIVSKPTSLGTLVAWNVTKALETDPHLDIKDAITSAQNQLENVSDSQDIQEILSEHPYTRYLACALLAWQRLGHHDADSLCRFLDDKKSGEENKSKLTCSSKSMHLKVSSIGESSNEFKFAKAVDASRYHSNSMGPVVKLPVETKVVMRAENKYFAPKITNKSKTPGPDVQAKINQACNLSSKCSEILMSMDSANEELRQRVGLLARRESERVELIERAETAWKDLEVGYLRKIALAEEKEIDVDKQIELIMAERNAYKKSCSIFVQELQRKADDADRDRNRLAQLEDNVYNRAYERHKKFEECAKGEAQVAEQACRASQIDRDLQFQEDQVRRKVLSLQSEADSACALAHEAERALRVELNGLRDQIKDVSEQLLQEDEFNKKIYPDMEALRQERLGLIEDLENCKTMCSGFMQEQVDELKEKSKKLAQLKYEVLDCKCQAPVEISVEVKRTPSLAAMCKCTPEHKIMKSCSCSSIRTRLMSDLLSDLFGGLQTELGMSVTQMPCQLLKCLEDKHNWDKNSQVKSNLKDYFSRLLVGELDIAIATSIERYHAKWMGLVCADTVNTMKPADGDISEGWQERAIEKRAQKLASQLAEQLFQDKADQLTQRAKEIMSSGPPPCECKSKSDKGTVFSGETNANKHMAVLPCMVNNMPTSKLIHNFEAPLYWNTIQNVRLPSYYEEDPTKDFTKKVDVKPMDVKVSKIITRNPPKAGPLPERNIETERKPVKKLEKRNFDIGKGRFNRPPIHSNEPRAVNYGMPLNKATKTGVKVTPDPGVPMYLHQTMQDVTQLRQQVENLKKESTASTNTKIDCLTCGNTVNESIKKELKINRTVSQLGLPNVDLNKPSTSKKKNNNMVGLPIINSKPRTSVKQRTDKPFNYKRNNTFAVNVCLLSNEKSKTDTTSWKQRASKESQQLSSKEQSNPTIGSLTSEDMIGARTNSKEFEEDCTENCACFHKIPSNISIDKLLETLAKWKDDLDASCNEKEAHKVHPDDSKHANEISQKFAAPMTTESEYMGAVNLDKSDEDPCKCIFADEKFKKTIPFKCISSSKCVCDKNSNKNEAKEIRSNISSTKLQVLVKDNTVMESMPRYKDDNKINSSQKWQALNHNDNENHETDTIFYQSNKISTYGENMNKENHKNVNKQHETNEFRDDVGFTGQEKLQYQKNDNNIHNIYNRLHENISPEDNDTVNHQEIDNIIKQNQIDISSEKNENKKPRKSDEKNVEQNKSKSFCSNPDCSYLIKFLGVTLAEATQPKKNNVNNHQNIKHNENISLNYTVQSEESQLDDTKTRKGKDSRENHERNINTDYEQVSITGYSKMLNNNILTKKSTSAQKYESNKNKKIKDEGVQDKDKINDLNEFDKLSNDLQGGGSSIFMNKNNTDKYTNCKMKTCPIFKQIKKTSRRKGNNENEDQKNIDARDKNNIKSSFKNPRANKATSDHQTTFSVCENYRHGKCIASKMNLNNTESETNTNNMQINRGNDAYINTNTKTNTNKKNSFNGTESDTLRNALNTKSSENRQSNRRNESYDHNESGTSKILRNASNETKMQTKSDIKHKDKNIPIDRSEKEGSKIHVALADKGLSKDDKKDENASFASRLNSAKSGKVFKHPNSTTEQVGSKTDYNMNSENYSDNMGPERSKIYNQAESIINTEPNINKQTSTLFQENKNISSGKEMLSCQCSAQLDEFKKFVDGTIPNKNNSEDVAVDVQNFGKNMDKNDCCVCHIPPSTDETKDLEENAFHLLEEYLKKKLEDFKSTSCSNSCIPPEEEEKLFKMILQRVKQLISDSTNQITCKCPVEERKSQGSWNRAYGLLQEYLRIKIKKIQCSCILIQDNNDTILPEVLGKVSHLIEYDFQRLKEVCACKNDEKKNLNVNFQASSDGIKGQIMYNGHTVSSQMPYTVEPSNTNQNPIKNIEQGIKSATTESDNTNYNTSMYETQRMPLGAPVSMEYYPYANQVPSVNGEQGEILQVPSLMVSNSADHDSVLYGNQIISPQLLNTTGFVRDNQGSAMYENQDNYRTSQNPPQMGFPGPNQGSTIYDNQGVSPQTPFNMWPPYANQVPVMYGDQGIPRQNTFNTESPYANQGSTVHGYQGIPSQFPYNMGSTNTAMNDHQGKPLQPLVTKESLRANLDPTTYVDPGVPSQIMESPSANIDRSINGYQHLPSQIPSKMAKPTNGGADADVNHDSFPEGKETHEKVIEDIDTIIDIRDQKLSQSPIPYGENLQYECPCQCRCDQRQNLNVVHTEIERDLLMKYLPRRNNVRNISYMINSKSVNTEWLTEAQPEEIKLRNQHDIERQNEDIEAIKQEILACRTDTSDTNAQQNKSSVCIYSEKVTQLCNTVSKTNQNNNHSTSSFKLLGNPTPPYIGYTIDCACKESLGVCVCTKSTSKNNANLVSSLWEDSLPNEAYYQNISYMVTSKSTEKTNVDTDLVETSNTVCLRSILKKSTINDVSSYDNKCEAVMNSLTEEEFILNDSVDNVNETHLTMMTNTFDDVTSIETDYSTNEDTLDWCECCSQYNHYKHSDTENLKSSIYFPAPITDFDDRLADVNENSANTKSLPKLACECEMIPICHVKMLVENIETRLANAKCTCDSLISKVCPVHSAK